MERRKDRHLLEVILVLTYFVATIGWLRVEPNAAFRALVHYAILELRGIPTPTASEGEAFPLRNFTIVGQGDNNGTTPI